MNVNQSGQRVYGPQINAENVYATQRESPDAILQRARRAIDEKLYAEAVKHFSDAITGGAPGADPHYYLALALLGGRKPSQLGAEANKIVPNVEEHLHRAIQIDPRCSHAYALWAAVKADYYRDRTEPSPSASELRAKVREIDAAHATELAPFLESPENPLWQAALRVAQSGINERRPNVHKYFIRTPEPPNLTSAQALMIAGACGGLLGLVLTIAGVAGSNSAGLLCLSVPLMAGAVYLAGRGYLRYTREQANYRRAYEAAEPKPTDEQMDKWLTFDRFGILDHALQTLDRNFEGLLREPQIVTGPAERTQQAVGRDGVMRFSRYKFVIMFLGHQRVSVYSCEWDFISAIVSNAETFDCRYSDITGLRTRQLHDVPRGGQLVLLEDNEEITVSFAKIFEMIIAGTDRIAVTVDVQTQHGEAELQPTGAAAAERLIRRQLDMAR